ncbi:SEFIR domain-containing protein [Neobacillus sp. BF23-41]|uniref:SEFIR domain-containing protein n=1 Tax=Neobacillus sp. BF23-41 TaxID=3240280 RepID=UPI0034E379DA
METVEKVPKVFISYSWSSEEHKKWVLNLAEKLVSESGVDVILDLGHDRFQFMEESIKLADKVLVICDKTYCEKANGRLGGVGTETIIITPSVYKDIKQDTLTHRDTRRGQKEEENKKEKQQQ